MSRFDIGRFKQPPDDELICGICKNVLDNPKESPCRHVFCKVCITRALQEKSKCPICRTSFREKHLKDVLPLVQNLLNKLPMECDHYENGCQQAIALEHYVNHIENCDYMMVCCKNASCCVRILKRDGDDHENNMCAYRTFVCEKGCQCKVVYADKDTHDCLKTLLQKDKDATRRIEELENTVKELEAKILKFNTASSSSLENRNHDADDNNDDNGNQARRRRSRSRSSSLNLDDSDLGSALSHSPFSYHDYDYSISSLSDMEPLYMGSPSLSISLGSDCSDDYRDRDDDDDDWGSGSIRSHNSDNDDNNRINIDDDNRSNNNEEEVQEEFIPMSHVDVGGEERNGDGGSGSGSDYNNDLFYDSLRSATGSSNNNSDHNDDDNDISRANANIVYASGLLSGSHNTNNNSHGTDDANPSTSNTNFPQATATGNSIDDHDIPSSSAGGPSTSSGQSGGSRSRGGRKRQTGSSSQTAKRARLGQSTSTAAGGSNNLNDNDNSRAPVRRSARLRNVPASPVDDTDVLPVPPSASFLLDMYSNEDNSSSDESWSPSAGFDC